MRGINITPGTLALDLIHEIGLGGNQPLPDRMIQEMDRIIEENEKRVLRQKEKGQA